MKVFQKVFLLLLMMVSFACTVQAQELKEQLVLDKGVSILVPVDWVLMSEDDRSTRFPYEVGPKEVYANEGATVTLAMRDFEIGEQITLEEVKAFFADQILAHLAPQSELLTMNGNEVLKISFTVEKANQDVENELYIILNADKTGGYLFDLNATSKLYPEWANTFAKIAGSIRLLK